jgi:DNA-binding response OmpR family regulator
MRSKRIPSADAPAKAPPQGEPSFRQRILVVEDDAAIRQVNSEVLTYCGYHVDVAEDGVAAWDALQLKSYDLMVTDNEMPKVTGIKLLQKIQAARLALPVIMATGAPPDEELLRHRLTPPAKTLLKPYTFDQLLTAVKEVLRAASDSLGEIATPPDWQSHEADGLGTE